MIEDNLQFESYPNYLILLGYVIILSYIQYILLNTYLTIDVKNKLSVLVDHILNTIYQYKSNNLRWFWRDRDVLENRNLFSKDIEKYWCWKLGITTYKLHMKEKAV